MKKILIVVDLQRDFISQEGSLYVPGGEELPNIIGGWIKENKDDLRKVVFTVDWHTPEDKSFTINGGTWPIHCLQYSSGASLPDVLLRLCIDLGIPYEISYKGNTKDQEEYGAFSRIAGITPWDTYKLTGIQSGIIEVSPRDEILICGVAGDYCVKETYNNLNKNLGKLVKISLLEEAIRYIGK